MSSCRLSKKLILCVSSEQLKYLEKSARSAVAPCKQDSSVQTEMEGNTLDDLQKKLTSDPSDLENTASELLCQRRPGEACRYVTL